VSSDRDDEAAAARAYGFAMDTAKPVLVGYDGRAETEVAFAEAVAEARARSTGLVVLVVAGLPPGIVDPVQPGGMGMGLAAFPEMTADGPVEIQPIMARAREKLAASGLEGRVDWSIGDPAAEILRVADEIDASAIVIGTHHHSALERLFGGDVTGSVVRHAHRDVVVAR
jgi:nucleotide-binding universal stress UspA family protein